MVTRMLLKNTLPVASSFPVAQDVCKHEWHKNAFSWVRHSSLSNVENYSWSEGTVYIYSRLTSVCIFMSVLGFHSSHAGPRLVCPCQVWP